jgi:hypothetical protein
MPANLGHDIRPQITDARMMDLLLIAVVAGVTWCVASEGAWGAAYTLLSVIISGLVSMSLFESVAGFLQQNLASSYEWQHRWDVIALVGLFAACVFGMRAALEYIAPVDIEVHAMAYDVARWACGFLTGYVTMAFLMTALHTAPLPREFLGFTPEPERRSGPLGGLAPDFQWLGFTQYVSENAFRRGQHGPIWDGPTYPIVAGAQGEPGEVKVWPSFPIRYATRRAQYFGSAAAAAPAAAPGGGAPVQAVPSGGRGTSNF